MPPRWQQLLADLLIGLAVIATVIILLLQLGSPPT